MQACFISFPLPLSIMNISGPASGPLLQKACFGRSDFMLSRQHSGVAETGFKLPKPEEIKLHMKKTGLLCWSGLLDESRNAISLPCNERCAYG